MKFDISRTKEYDKSEKAFASRILSFGISGFQNCYIAATSHEPERGTPGTLNFNLNA